MTATLSIETETLRAVIAPGLGGALLRFEAKRRAGGAPEPLFRPVDEAALRARPFEPNTAACYPLVPWVSRLCPPVLPTDGGSLAIPPNWPGEAYPLHGWGARSEWTVLTAGATAVILGLEHSGPPAFSAELAYTVEEARLHIALSVTNRMSKSVGLGLGLHPWLPRKAGGELEAPATIVWTSGSNKIPVKSESPPPEWDFQTPRPLPAGDLDNGFAGWNGRARYTWPAADGRWALAVDSDFDNYIIYAPAGETFFCFEPTSHKPSPGQTGELDGLVMVPPGATLRREAAFSVTEPDAPPE